MLLEFNQIEVEKLRALLNILKKKKPLGTYAPWLTKHLNSKKMIGCANEYSHNKSKLESSLRGSVGKHSLELFKFRVIFISFI